MENTNINKPLVQNDSENNHISNGTSHYGSDFVHIMKRTEKLASATYLVTGLFADSEPMKWSLRKKVSDLVSFISSYKDIRQTELSAFSSISKSKITEIISLLEVSNLGGLVTEMNFSILKQEFVSLINTIESNKQKTESNTVLPLSFFDTKDDRVFLPNIAKNSSQNIYPAIRTNTLKDTLSLKDTSVFKSNNRQSIIIGLLKKKKELTIKDISTIIKDVSEKTIQRELISLINAGVVKKTGERRWSKYFLNTAN